MSTYPQHSEICDLYMYAALKITMFTYKFKPNLHTLPLENMLGKIKRVMLIPVDLHHYQVPKDSSLGCAGKTMPNKGM